MLTLGGHGFYWFELSRPAAPAAEEESWETTTSSTVAQSLLESGLVSEGAPGGSGGLGTEAPTTTAPEGEA
jgi:maltose alpha-D-glucosyltransferase/alpha-amylase